MRPVQIFKARYVTTRRSKNKENLPVAPCWCGWYIGPMDDTPTNKAIVLLSGGLDSATCVAEAKAAGYDVYALSFRYGQRHSVELDAAITIARQMQVAEHRIIDIDLAQFGGSALTADIDVPKARDIDDMADGIPITYVPARNTIFMSYALAWGAVLPSNDNMSKKAAK